ncbi:MAG: autotransporter domain-containing protein [Chlamydiales bacterium]|nr:autotransporter domain-containing protein [Chlamydiales bacterium]
MKKHTSIILSSLLLLISSSGFTSDTGWTGQVSENWSNSQNWDTNSLPGNNDTIELTSPSGGDPVVRYNINVDGAYQARQLLFRQGQDAPSGYTIYGTGPLQLNFGGSPGNSTIISYGTNSQIINVDLVAPNGIDISHIDTNATMTINGNISGTNLANTGTSTVILGGNNTYTGTTNVNAGTLVIQGSIAGTDVTVNDSATLNVTGSVTSNSVTVNSGGLLSIAGGANISNGTTIQPGGTLVGTGNVGSLTNSGTVIPGHSIGTINIGGNFTQSSSGNLEIEISEDGSSDLLNITGNATLDGILTLEPEPGLYPEGIRYTFMNYTGRTGTLTLIEDTGLQFSIEYQGTFAELVNATSGPILPVKRDRLRGIALSVANYLFCPGPFPTNRDLITVMRALLKSPPGQFKSNLKKLSPAQFGALPLVNTQSNRLIANMFVQNAEKYNWCDPCQTKTNAQNGKRNTSVWITPVGHYYNQEGIQNQVGFDAYAVGAGIGVNHFFSNCVLFGGGAGYTYSKIDWDKNRGDGHIHSVYVGPSLGLVFEKLYFNFLAMGSYNSYDINRKIQFPGINRTASNTHHSYDVLGRIDGGYKFRADTGGSQNNPYFIIPEVSVSYLNVFEEGYTESGADSINLSVNRKYSAFLQPNLLIKVVREVCTSSWCITPSFHAGWISNIPLTSGNYKASLYKQNLCHPDFVVKSFHRTMNQLSVGVGLYLRSISDWIMDINFKTDCLDNSFVTSGNFKVEKRF